MNKRILIFSMAMLIVLLFSACRQHIEQDRSLEFAEEGLSVKQFEMIKEVSKELNEEKENSVVTDLDRTIYLSQLKTAAIVHEAMKRGIRVTRKEALGFMKESEKTMPEDFRELYEKSLQKSADYLEIPLEQYREDYLIPNVQKTILSDKLRKEIIPHENQKELIMLIHEWETFVYKSVLSYLEDNKDEVERFKQEIGLDYEIKRFDFISRE